ncbi:ribonuclease H-like domain-containing protein [Suillus occidentalis]|nr:ribonuclease H-like domain-containing protein [Suillus occidentalis]
MLSPPPESLTLTEFQDNVIKKWAVDIGIGAQEIYSQHNTELPPKSTAGTKQQQQTLLDSTCWQQLSTSQIVLDNSQTVESSASSRGRPVHTLMQKLVIKTTIMSKDGKPKVSWKCISCDHSRKGSPQEIRVLKHSATCKKLPVHLQNEAITASKDTSLGAQLVEAPPVEEQPHMDEPPAKWPKNQVALNVAPYHDVGQKKQEEERQIFQTKADHIIMRLICSLYTVHATTPDRTTHFLDGHEDSTASHTAAWVKEKMLEAREDKWAAICSDSTAVTKNARREVVDTIPTILDLCDACHHLHNTIKNITLLPEFEQMLSLLKPIIKHFSKSTISAAHLRKERWVDDDDETNRKVKDMFLNRRAFQTLEQDLGTYVMLVGPFIRSLWSLEASHANASDVFVFWLAIAATLEELFAKGEEQTGIPVSLARCVTAIFNSRWKEFFSNDVYFVAFALDPRYPLSDNIMKSALAAPTIHIPAQISNVSASAERPMPHPRAYHRVKEFLKPMLRAMVEHNKVHELKDPISLLVHEIGAAGVVDEFRRQLEAYFHNEWPFNTPLQDGNTLAWWNMLLPHPHACVLAALAVKIFSVLINSMPDERTGSKLTWLNSAIRGNQNAQTLVDMIQIGQWYGTRQWHGFWKPTWVMGMGTCGLGRGLSLPTHQIPIPIAMGWWVS